MEGDQSSHSRAPRHTIRDRIVPPLFCLFLFLSSFSFFLSSSTRDFSLLSYGGTSIFEIWISRIRDLSSVWSKKWIHNDNGQLMEFRTNSMELNVSQLINRYAKRDFIRIIRRSVISPMRNFRYVSCSKWNSWKNRTLDGAKWNFVRIRTCTHTHTYIYIWHVCISSKRNWMNIEIVTIGGMDLSWWCLCEF